LAAKLANGTCKESKDNKEKKRLQNINNMVFHNVIEIEDSEQQQNVEPTKKPRTTIEVSDDEDVRIPTRTNLDRRGIDLDSVRCPLCDEDLESEDHIFVSCEIASGIWKDVLH
ncbi:RNA-directed DNA polymerase, eukaryota, reverse transcriptase zinc-binding domain protein, partial [Tanacetum coccineum]